MANPSTPSRASRNAPQHKVHRYIDALFIDDFGRQSKLTTESANGFARKKLDTASQSLQVKIEGQEKKARRIEIREWRAAELSVAAELRESDHRARLLGRSIKTKVRPEQKIQHVSPKERKRAWPYAAVALPKYDGPVIDRNGQRGVFMRVRYYSRRTAEVGVSQRVVTYCFNGAELDLDGNPYVATNIGQTIDEALCGFDHLEQVNWSAAKNAKLLMHGILAVDHRQSPDEMMTCGLRWAEETLGRFDLPYLVTLHAPPPDGDQRNWHLHILWSFRPMVRTGDHEWQVGEMLRTDLDNPKAMKVFREMFASVMTEMSFEAGQNQVWTAKSNADRGLPHEPQVHLDAAKTNQARSGEHVAENEENHERVMRSKEAVIDDTLRHADQALARVQNTARAAAARFTKTPMLPMRVPERIVAATMTLGAPSFGSAVPLSAIQVVAPPLPKFAIEPAPIMGPIERPKYDQLRPSSFEMATSKPPQLAPRAAAMEIANLRFRPAPRAKTSIGPVHAIPPARLVASELVLSAPLAAIPPRRTTADYATTLPPTIFRAAAMRISELAITRSAPLADMSMIEGSIDRSHHAAQRDKDRRKRERDDAERSAREAQAASERSRMVEQELGASEPASLPSRRSASWHRARHLREKARVAWGDLDRTDHDRVAQPGNVLPRLDASEMSIDRPNVTRKFPSNPGPRIDD